MLKFWRQRVINMITYLLLMRGKKAKNKLKIRILQTLNFVCLVQEEGSAKGKVWISERKDLDNWLFIASINKKEKYSRKLKK